MIGDIELKVPLITQTNGKDYCNLACVQMISTYFNKPITQEEMAVVLTPVIKNGNVGITPATAKIMIEKGFQTSIRTRQTDLMTENIIDREFTDVDALQEALQNQEWSKASLDQWEQYLAFVAAGGILNTTLTTLNTIDEALHKNIPCRINIAPKAIHPDSSYFAHAVVVSGIDGGSYIIHDPAERFSKPYKVERNQLLFAWYARGATILLATRE